MRNNKRNTVAALLIALSLVGMVTVFNGCKQPNKKGSNKPVINKPEELPPDAVWDNIDSMSQTLTAFEDLHIKGKVFVELKKGTSYGYAKREATVQFGQQGQDVYITGEGKITITMPMVNYVTKLDVTLEDSAWLHFTGTINVNLASLTINAHNSTVTSHTGHDALSLSIRAKASTINLFNLEPVHNLTLDLQQGSIVTLYRNYSHSLTINTTSFIDGSSTLKAFTNSTGNADFNAALKAALSPASYARVVYTPTSAPPKPVIPPEWQ